MMSFSQCTKKRLTMQLLSFIDCQMNQIFIVRGTKEKQSDFKKEIHYNSPVINTSKPMALTSTGSLLFPCPFCDFKCNKVKNSAKTS